MIMKILIDWIRNSHSLGFAPVSDFSPQELGPFLRFNEDIVGHFPNAPGIPRSTAVYLAAIRSCGRSAGRSGGGWGDPEVFLVMVIS